MSCCSCRREVPGGWLTGDGRLFCLYCIREALAVAESVLLNRKLQKILEERP